jgi:hypothetical protein
MRHLFCRHGPSTGWLGWPAPRSAHRAVLTLPVSLRSTQPFGHPLSLSRGWSPNPTQPRGLSLRWSPSVALSQADFEPVDFEQGAKPVAGRHMSFTRQPIANST